mgnify:CR=1 FL=1|tara:strand:- start:153 stop:434 length:282 start_codon:yes stop_codon:yes gene_type:complete
MAIVKVGARPLGDRIIVEAVVDSEELSAGGVILPDSARVHPDQARVVAIGKGDKIDVAVGDIIHVAQFCGTPIEVEGTPYRVINYDEIIAVKD